MIDAIGSNSMPLRPEPKPLTEDQSNAVNDILSGYDADNLSASDAKEIAGQLKESGVNPGPALGNAISEAGFDAKAIGRLADAPPPPRKPEKELQGLPGDGVSIQV